MSGVSSGAWNGPGAATVCAGSTVPEDVSAAGVLGDVCPDGLPEAELAGAEPAGVDDEPEWHPASRRAAAVAALSRPDTPPFTMNEG
jgi:hypothetical protein